VSQDRYAQMLASSATAFVGADAFVETLPRIMSLGPKLGDKINDASSSEAQNGEGSAA
jgi:hypothetical protein